MWRNPKDASMFQIPVYQEARDFACEIGKLGKVLDVECGNPQKLYQYIYLDKIPFQTHLE